MDSSKVQHVNKKSSDELLRKFAATDDDEESTASLKKESKRRLRRRRSSGGGGGGGGGGEGDESHCESPSRRSLLAPAAGTRKSKLLRQLGVHSRAHLKAREIRHKSLFGTIGKTWRRTVEGASKVFMEKHYNRHKRLINDIIV